MRVIFSAATLCLCTSQVQGAAFVSAPGVSSSNRLGTAQQRSNTVAVKGYLDDLQDELKRKTDEGYNADTESLEATTLDRKQVDRYGPGSWESYKDFGDEFDGGDGQMGVAGDGNKGLEKMGSGPSVTPSYDNSRARSAKNAWGTSSGYADELMAKNPGMDVSRAQQMENWANQREVWKKQQYVKEIEQTLSAQQSTAEEDWRKLAKFGVERNQDFDLDAAFGAVVPGNVDATLEFKTLIGRAETHEIEFKNEYMGFADFRARFTSDSAAGFDVHPAEGSCSKTPTTLTVRYRPDSIGVNEATLVIETEDFKKTYKLIGSTG